MIHAVKSEYLKKKLQDEVNDLSKLRIDLRLNEVVNGRFHPNYKDHALVYLGFEGKLENESIRIYARKTTLEEIEKSIKPEDMYWDGTDLEQNKKEVAGGQSLYDSILVEARIGCVRHEQHDNEFKEQLKEIIDSYKKESWAKLELREKPCSDNAQTYLLQGLFDQRVFSHGVGLLDMHMKYIFKPYSSLKSILKKQSRSRKRAHSF